MVVSVKCNGAHVSLVFPRTIEVISRHEQLQTKLRRNVHVGYIFCIPHLLVVVKVLANFFQHEAVDVIEDAGVGFGLDEAVYLGQGLFVSVMLIRP